MTVSAAPGGIAGASAAGTGALAGCWGKAWGKRCQAVTGGPRPAGMPPPAAQGRRVTARTARTTQARMPQSAGRWSRCEGVTRGPGAPKRLTCDRPRVSVGGWLSPLPEADRVSGLTEGRGEDRRRSDRAAATVDSQRRGRTPWHDRAGGSARSGGASALDEPRLVSDGTWRPWAAGRGQNFSFLAGGTR